MKEKVNSTELCNVHFTINKETSQMDTRQGAALYRLLPIAVYTIGENGPLRYCLTYIRPIGIQLRETST